MKCRVNVLAHTFELGEMTMDRGLMAGGRKPDYESHDPSHDGLHAAL